MTVIVPLIKVHLLMINMVTVKGPFNWYFNWILGWLGIAFSVAFSIGGIWSMVNNGLKLKFLKPPN